MTLRQRKRSRWGPAQNLEHSAPVNSRAVVNGKMTSELPQLWHNLPTELKVSILSHNLISPTGIKSYRFYHHTCDDNCPVHQRVKHFDAYDRRVTLDQELVFYCLVFPELAQMLLQTYYTQNTFIVHLPLSHRVQPQFLLPPLRTRSLIREIRWKMTLSESNWDHTRRFAAGSFGFDKLQFITVYVMWPWFPDCCACQYLRPENGSRRRKILFGCRGRLIFQDDDYREENVRRTLAYAGTTREAIKEWIGGLVQFAE